MAAILLIKGREVLVDDDRETLMLLAQFNWNFISGGYAVTTFRQFPKVPRTVGMHRLVMGDIDSPLVVDHINRNPLDNRRQNLRICTRSTNAKNTKNRPNCSSKHRGVSRRGERWQVVVRCNGALKWLGTFDTEQQAANVAAPYFDNDEHNPQPPHKSAIPTGEPGVIRRDVGLTDNTRDGG